jgi:hypothetical protein
VQYSPTLASSMQQNGRRSVDLDNIFHDCAWTRVSSWRLLLAATLGAAGP